MLSIMKATGGDDGGRSGEVRRPLWACSLTNIQANHDVHGCTLYALSHHLIMNHQYRDYGIVSVCFLLA